MPKVLIISSVFPPQSDVGGLRPAMMAKYLPRYDWEPFVLTRDYGSDHTAKNEKMNLGSIVSDDHIVRVEVTKEEEKDYLNKRGFFGTIRDVVTIEKAFPPGVFDKVWATARQRFKKSDVDIIWATFPDFPTLRLARELSECLKVPWIADFRDITEQEQGVDSSWRVQLLHMRSNLRRKMLVQNASCLTSVSKFHCRTLQTKTGKSCDLIYNGYDTELFQPLAPLKSEKFKIVYMGRILSKSIRNPCLFFKAMDSLVSKGFIDEDKAEIYFYGVELNILQAIAGKFRSWKLCISPARVDYTAVSDILRNASILLLLTERGRNGILTTKLFEYLAVERPILCVRTEPESEIAEIINEANAGYAGDDLDTVQDYILRCYNQWLDQGYCNAQINRDYVQIFSRESQAMRLAAVLHRVAESSTHKLAMS